MAVQYCTVTIDGEKKRYEKGITYRESAEESQPRYEHQRVHVFVEGLRLQELAKNGAGDWQVTIAQTADGTCQSAQLGR